MRLGEVVPVFKALQLGLNRLLSRLENAAERAVRRPAGPSQFHRRHERGTAAARKPLLLALHSVLIDQPLASIRAAIAEPAQLREPPTVPQHRSASPSLLASRIRAQDLLEIGAHTVSCPVLSRLEPDEQYREIVDCKAQLEALLGRRVTSFSYPYGQSGQYNSESLRHVHNGGFCVACTAVSDTVRATSDPMRPPPIWVRNVAGDAFGRPLRRWTGV